MFKSIVESSQEFTIIYGNTEDFHDLRFEITKTVFEIVSDPSLGPESRRGPTQNSTN